MLYNIIILEVLLIKNLSFDIGKLYDEEVMLRMRGLKNLLGLLKMRGKYKGVDEMRRCMNLALILKDHRKFFFFDFLMRVVLTKTFVIFQDIVKFH